MRRKTFIILLVTVVVLGGVIGGAFAGGMTIGKSQGREEADQEWQNQFSQLPSRFGGEGDQPGTADPGFQFPRGLLGRGRTVGDIEKMEEGVLEDILYGDSITVSGEHNEDGSIEATNIFITPSSGTE